MRKKTLAIRSWGSLIVTVLVFAAFFWVLYVWLDQINSSPIKDRKGNVVRDQWQRAKDVMIFVGPFATAAIGYWFGSDGKDKAEKAAGRAEQKADREQKQKEALLSAGPEDLLARARQNHPKAFGEQSGG